MACEGDAPAEQRDLGTGDQVFAACHGGAGKNRSRGPDEGVDGVPEAVHTGNLAGQESG